MKILQLSATTHEEKRVLPLSQSRHGDMACEILHVLKHVRDKMFCESEPARRGTEIHLILFKHINFLVQAKRETDLEVFDALIRGASGEARESMETFRDNHALDPGKIPATELRVALDQDFCPIEDSDDGEQPPNTRGRSTS